MRFDQLPSEILWMIFENFSEDSDTNDAVSLVCRKFYEVIKVTRRDESTTITAEPHDLEDAKFYASRFKTKRLCVTLIEGAIPQTLNLAQYHSLEEVTFKVFLRSHNRNLPNCRIVAPFGLKKVIIKSKLRTRFYPRRQKLTYYSGPRSIYFYIYVFECYLFDQQNLLRHFGDEIIDLGSLLTGLLESKFYDFLPDKKWIESHYSGLLATTLDYLDSEANGIGLQEALDLASTTKSVRHMTNELNELALNLQLDKTHRGYRLTKQSLTPSSIWIQELENFRYGESVKFLYDGLADRSDKQIYGRGRFYGGAFDFSKLLTHVMVFQYQHAQFQLESVLKNPYVRVLAFHWKYPQTESIYSLSESCINDKIHTLVVSQVFNAKRFMDKIVRNLKNVRTLFCVSKGFPFLRHIFPFTGLSESCKQRFLSEVQYLIITSSELSGFLEAQNYMPKLKTCVLLNNSKERLPVSTKFFSGRNVFVHVIQDVNMSKNLGRLLTKDSFEKIFDILIKDSNKGIPVYPGLIRKTLTIGNVHFYELQGFLSVSSIIRVDIKFIFNKSML